MKIEQLGNPRDYVAAMLRRDLDLKPTPEEIDRLTASLLAAGAFAPDVSDIGSREREYRAQSAVRTGPRALRPTKKRRFGPSAISLVPPPEDAR